PTAAANSAFQRMLQLRALDAQYQEALANSDFQRAMQLEELRARLRPGTTGTQPTTQPFQSSRGQPSNFGLPNYTAINPFAPPGTYPDSAYEGTTGTPSAPSLWLGSNSLYPNIDRGKPIQLPTGQSFTMDPTVSGTPIDSSTGYPGLFDPNTYYNYGFDPSAFYDTGASYDPSLGGF
ncbi:MAG: hypothetical protein KGJ13_09545, partial [Patescibacteria group bacterium]|nr:hypothetical protein [Patescibacteria group bacterium]